MIWGCGQPGGEAGYNMARVAAVLAGLPDVPGVTVNRYCSSSLQTIRMAAHAIKAGEGDVFVAAGVETVSRYQFGAADTGPHNPKFDDGRGAHRASAAQGGRPTWTPPAGLPDIYIAMGQTAENVARGREASPARRWTSSPRSRSTARSPSQENGFFEREITPVTLPDGTVVAKDDGPAPAPRSRSSRSSSRCSGPTARSPPATRARSTTAPPPSIVMSDTKASELGITPLARIVASGVSGAQPGDHGPRPDRGVPAGARARAGMTIDDIDLVEINEAFAAQVIPSAKHLGIAVGQAQRERRRHRPRPPVRHDRRPHHDHAAQRARGRGQDASASRRCASAAARAWP